MQVREMFYFVEILYLFATMLRIFKLKVILLCVIIIILSDVMLSMVMFSVHLMSVVMLTAVGLSVVVMIGVAPSFKASLSIFCLIFNQ